MAGSPSRRPRSGSEGDEVANVNVNWVTASPALWFFYLFCLVVFRIAIYPTPLTVAWSWTFTVIVHGLIQFFGLHWAKGTAIWWDQGAHRDETFWEQLDGGVPWTSSKKILLIIPVALLLWASHATNYEMPHIAINGFVTLVLVIGKLPEMHRVRVFGVNKTPGLEE